jgi:hypothetical protein
LAAMVVCFCKLMSRIKILVSTPRTNFKLPADRVNHRAVLQGACVCTRIIRARLSPQQAQPHCPATLQPDERRRPALGWTPNSTSTKFTALLSFLPKTVWLLTSYWLPRLSLVYQCDVLKMPVVETIAVVASIIAIIQISDQVISSCKFYIQAASDTPSELRAILVEISTLKSVLESLQFLETCAHAAPALWKHLSGQDGPIEECRRSITDLEKLFPADKFPVAGSLSGSKRRKVQRVRISLAWPLKARRARELLQIIIQQKTIINLALTTESR